VSLLELPGILLTFRVCPAWVVYGSRTDNSRADECASMVLLPHRERRHRHGAKRRASFPGFGRVARRSDLLQASTDPDGPVSGIRLLGNIDSLRAQRAGHNPHLGKRVALEKTRKMLPLERASVGAPTEPGAPDADNSPTKLIQASSIARAPSMRVAVSFLSVANVLMRRC
jgi:hypothetical protein